MGVNRVRVDGKTYTIFPQNIFSLYPCTMASQLLLNSLLQGVPMMPSAKISWQYPHCVYIPTYEHTVPNTTLYHYTGYRIPTLLVSAMQYWFKGHWQSFFFMVGSHCLHSPLRQKEYPGSVKVQSLGTEQFWGCAATCRRAIYPIRVNNTSNLGDHIIQDSKIII